MCERIAVTGAGGWVGKEVCRWLEATGADVRRVSRAFGGPELATAGPEQWARAFEGCGTVVHCAAHVHRSGETLQEQERFREINVSGIERVLAGCEVVGVARFVFASTVAVYDSSALCPWDEDSSLLPTTAYGRSKAEGESRVAHSRLQWRIARLGTVFGAGDRANFLRLASALRRRRFVLPGKGTARTSVIPLDRAAEVLGRLALLDVPGNVLVNSAMPEAPSLGQICEAFADVCGFTRPARVPLPLLRFVAQLGDLVGGKILLNTAVLAKLTNDTVVDTSRLESILPEIRWQRFRDSMAPAALYYIASENG